MLFSLIVLALYLLVKYFINFNEHKILKIIFNTLLIITFFLAGTQVFFGVFEGFVQSFVLTMLTITYLAVGVQDEEEVVEEN